ncbi:MAG TPA: hypothetical protein VK638_55250, partial [Edaphobacter sp.]|nr:hypothetical protein [Edaphobacter sp.]
MCFRLGLQGGTHTSTFSTASRSAHHVGFTATELQTRSPTARFLEPKNSYGFGFSTQLDPEHKTRP